MAQTLEQQNIIEQIKLVVITNNLHDVTGTENLCPEKATILGPCNVIPQEYLNITCSCIDIVFTESGNKQSQRLVKYLLSELASPVGDRLIAYRGNHRWIKTYEALHIDENTTSKTKLRKGGVYLITGGLGNIGFAMSEYLAKTMQAKLILIGRKDIPQRHQWSEYLLTHDESNEVSYKLRKIIMLEELGAEVQVISADVANEQQMQKAMALANERFGEINGVIHAAGINDDAYYNIPETSLTQSQSQFHPKVYGLFALEKVLRGQKLDFCLLTSSSSSVLGGMGLTSYSAANIFMDVYAHKHNQMNSFPYICTNWDTWQSQDSEKQDIIFGLALEKIRMTPQEGIEVLRRLLSINTTVQMIISAGELQPRIDEWIKREFLRNKKATNEENLFSNYQRPNLQTAYAPPRNEVEQKITRVWQQLLGIGEIGIYDNFFELGGDSLISVQVTSQLQRELNVQIPIVSIYNKPTISSLAQIISGDENKEDFGELSHDRGQKRREKKKRQRIVSK